MSGIQKLFRKAQRSPRNYAYSDLVTLLRGVGYEFERQKGSHAIFCHPVNGDVVNVQAVGSQAKPYQVRQVVAKIEELGLLGD